MDAYIRVSDVGGREGERYASPTLQRKDIEAAAQRYGVTIEELVVEEDVSGTKAASERGLEELIARCERGESDGLIVSNVDRLSRGSLKETADIYDRLDRCGARLIAAAEGIDSRSEGSELSLNMMAVIARAQWRRYQANWRRARALSTERGAFPSQTPWGYQRDKDSGKLIPHPDIAPVVQEMFQRRGDGASIADLGRWLESKWIRTPNGKGTTWSHSTIAQILRNRVYLGEQTHGEFVNPHAHDPIVTEMEFNAAQVAKPVRQSAPKAHSANSLLMGLARCAGCGHTLKIVTGHGGKLRYYCKGPYTTGPCPARCNPRRRARPVGGELVPRSDPRQRARQKRRQSKSEDSQSATGSRGSRAGTRRIRQAQQRTRRKAVPRRDRGATAQTRARQAGPRRSPIGG